MSIFDQVLWGTLLLALCSMIHVSMVSGAIRVLPRVAHWAHHRLPAFTTSALVGSAFAMIVVTHLVQIAIWAFALINLSAFEGLEPALYFSLVTYTTLGYGDVTLGPNLRLFAAFASITGLLTFGLSTAFLVGLVARVLPEQDL